MKTVTLKDGQKAVQIRVTYRSVYGIKQDDTYYVVKRYGKLYVGGKREVQHADRARLHYYANIIVGVKTFLKLVSNGGDARVFSGYADPYIGKEDKWGADAGRMSVKITANRATIIAPCGATIALTQKRAEKLVEAVKSL